MKKLSLLVLSVITLSEACFAGVQKPEESSNNSQQNFQPIRTQEEPQKRLRYNPHGDEWSYQSQNAQLKYNPHQDRWEWVE